MKVLVTGGAGYIGSVAVKRLVELDHNVVVIDNLAKGLRKLVDSHAEFYEGDLLDRNFLGKVFQNHKFESVMHFAGYKDAGESMENPGKYSQNIAGSINLLDEIVKHKVPQIIFSSSAAVYGEPESIPIDEEHPTNPTNYYGFTKLKVEELIRWYANLHKFRYLCLRYFNVAGDGGLGYIDPNATNILPILMEVAANKRDKVIIFGSDYDTRDGTCIRDYIDVNDLIEAHLEGLSLDNNEVINLGTSKGVSVLEMIKAVETVVKKKLKFEIGPRRSGDPACLTASFTRAKNVLGWEPRMALEKMIASTWKAYRS